MIKLPCIVCDMSFHIHHSRGWRDTNWRLKDPVLDTIGQVEVPASESCWDWQRDTHVGVKSDGNPLALGTFKSWLVLALQEIDDNWLVSLQVTLPMFLSNYFIRSIGRIALLYIGLLEDTIEVLVYRIQEEVQKLLGIMLVVPSEHRVLFTEDPLEMVGRIDIVWFVPYLI